MHKAKYRNIRRPFTGVLQSNFANFKYCNVIKKGLQHSCFLVKFATFLKTAFFTGGYFWKVRNLFKAVYYFLKFYQKKPLKNALFNLKYSFRYQDTFNKLLVIFLFLVKKRKLKMACININCNFFE